MATVEEIMTGVQRELSYAAGRNVQIHTQDRIGYKISRLYRSLNTKYWWEDSFRSKTVTLTGNGDINENIKSEIARLKDVHSVFIKDDTTPLTWSVKGQNIARIRARSLYPAPTMNMPFTILPLTQDGTALINYRYHIEKDFELEEEVPLDKDLLILGVASQMAVSDSLNLENGKLLMSQYTDHLQTLIKSEIKTAYTSSQYGYDPITEWTIR